MGALQDSGGFLIDLDGTLIRDNAALPGAVAFFDSVQDRAAIVSNDAEHTPIELARLLAGMGFPISPRRLVLAGATAVEDLARRQGGARVLMLASRSLKEHARDHGLSPVENDPDVVLLGRDRQFSFPRLADAANAVRGGAALVVANPDRVHPGPRGSVVPETGALLAALLACTGPVGYRMIGKPEATLFEAGLAALGLAASKVMMIGDNPATDGEGARRMGLRYLEICDGILPAPLPIRRQHPVAAMV